MIASIPHNRDAATRKVGTRCCRTVVCFAALSAIATAVSPVLADPSTVSANGPVRFARDVQPILAEKCYRCHGPDSKSRMADLRLDTATGAFLSRPGGSAFVAGAPERSLAFQRIVAADPARRMPPPGSNLTLTRAQIERIRTWIVKGAKWEKHWAYEGPVRPPLPNVKDRTWVRNPIDTFILARLEREGLKPSPAAGKLTLLRRVTLDLTGIPPTLEEAAAHVADRSPNAYEHVVDRLLASPRYGERMAWDWLDLARYADTNGYQEDRERPMWPWRDWVVRALNANMPYDEFVIEQLAGDLLPNPTVDQRIATGLCRNHMLNGEGGAIAEESRVNYVLDRVETVSTAFLGLTLNCCRCHDHKYDPFTQRDYYSLSAYFNSVPESGAVDGPNGTALPVLALPTPEQSARLAELQKQVDTLTSRLNALDTKSSQRADVQKQLDAARKAVDDFKRSILSTMVMEDQKQPRDTFILVRGVYDKHADKVTCGVPAELNPLSPSAPPNRLALARWLVTPDNPLTARVTVNRLWQMLFGTGLVKTAEDFGVQGERPSHRELLDWLATELVRRNWDLKAMLKLIVMSATYRQSSNVTPALLARDPENRLLARGPRYRLPAWMLRDQALALSGLLNEKIGGPPVRPYQPEGVWEDFSYGKIRYTQDHGDALYRRSLYVFWRRSVGPTMFFDSAARRNCTVRLARTNTPIHALTLLNDVTFVEAARLFAERAIKSALTPAARIDMLFRLATLRRPTSTETAILTQSYERNVAYYRADRAAADKLTSVGERKREPSLDVADLASLTAVASLVLNLDETISKE